MCTIVCLYSEFRLAYVVNVACERLLLFYTNDATLALHLIYFSKTWQILEELSGAVNVT